MKHGMKTACALLLLLTLLLNAAATGSVQVDMVSRTAGESSIVYPEIKGLANTFAQDQINETIVNAITPHLNTFTVLEAGTGGQLTMESHARVFPSTDGHDLLSVLITANGCMTRKSILCRIPTPKMPLPAWKPWWKPALRMSCPTTWISAP